MPHNTYLLVSHGLVFLIWEFRRQSRWSRVMFLQDIFCNILIWLVLWNHGFLWLSIQLGMENHPNWRIHIFQRGRYTTNQYPMVNKQFDPENHQFSMVSLVFQPPSARVKLLIYQRVSNFCMFLRDIWDILHLGETCPGHIWPISISDIPFVQAKKWT